MCLFCTSWPNQNLNSEFHEFLLFSCSVIFQIQYARLFWFMLLFVHTCVKFGHVHVNFCLPGLGNHTDRQMLLAILWHALKLSLISITVSWLTHHRLFYESSVCCPHHILHIPSFLYFCIFQIHRALKWWSVTAI